MPISIRLPRANGLAWSLLLCVALPVILLIALGFDASWDLRNYHVYNPHAWWTGRDAIDIAPAQRQSWHNPLLDLPLYLLLRAGAHSALTSAWLLLPNIACVALLLALFRRLSPRPPSRTAEAMLVLLALSGAAFLSTLALSTNDNFVAAAVLASLWFVCRRDPPAVPRDWLYAGLIAGAVVGLKLTAVPFCIGLAVAALVVPGSAAARLRVLAALALGGVAGFLLTFGYWGMRMLLEHGNPFFPYYNQVFLSPDVPAHHWTDPRFRQVGLDILLAPVHLATRTLRFAEMSISDPRILFGLASLPIVWLAASGKLAPLVAVARRGYGVVASGARKVAALVRAIELPRLGFTVRVEPKVFARATLAFAVALALFAAATHAPGHVSMDSSVQLYEAAIGRSVSWFPPFPSALLRWFGGGTQATLLFVILCVTCTYAGLALSASAPVGGRFAALARLVVVLALIANPIVFLNVGVVWKDVLFAALLALALGLMFAASTQGPRRSAWMLVVAGLLLLPTPLVRQHGVIVAPILIAAIVFCIARRQVGSRPRMLAATALVGGYLLAYAGISYVVDATVPGSRGNAAGVTILRRYEITGLIAGGADVARLPASLRKPEVLEAIRDTYTAERIDNVMAEPAVTRAFSVLDAERIGATWKALVRRDPMAYVEMKADQFAWLLSLHRVEACLPIYLGVDGNHEYLQAAGVSLRVDERDRQLYQLSKWLQGHIVHRHWFYLLLFAVCIAYLLLRRRQLRGDRRALVLGSVVATAALYASFLPTVLACDFRYLYPCLLMVSLLAISLLARPLAARSSLEPT